MEILLSVTAVASLPIAAAAPKLSACGLLFAVAAKKCQRNRYYYRKKA